MENEKSIEQAREFMRLVKKLNETQKLGLSEVIEGLKLILEGTG